MMPTGHHSRAIVAPALAGLLASAALAEDAGQDYADSNAPWNRARAWMVSDLCLAPAPGFAGFAAAALAAGFTPDGDGFVRPPDAAASVYPAGDNDEFCICFVGFGAPDVDAMLLAVNDRLIVEWADDWRPVSTEGNERDTWFRRDGVDVRVVMTPKEIDAKSYVYGQIVAHTECST